ncbi:MAG: sulfatase-like hydrolase/transferase [Acidobacteriota bacterium]|nr:sulfatase-like hydrolase/transferase [Acidobacteriota bacterium]
MEQKYSRRGFIGSTGATLLAGLASPAAGRAEALNSADGGQQAAAESRSRPNLVLFMPDELRADALACYGNPVCKTPNLDKLATEGARFANCHVQYPVCGASRCSLLTGWPTSVRGHRSLAYFLRPEEPNLFRYLRQAGYDVFWFGKNDALAAQSFYQSVTQWNYLDHMPVGGSGGGGGGRAGAPKREYARTFISEAHHERTATNDYRCLEAGIRILERREADRPFCIFLPLSSPHPPYGPPDGFRNMHKPSEITGLRPIGLPRKPNYIEAIRKAYGIDKMPEETFRQVRALYYDSVSYTDWLLGELMDAMERTNRAKDTALFVLSDHGDYAGDYGLVEKWPSGLEDTLTHVPIIARVPGGKPNWVSHEIVELFDVMATCLELAGTHAHHTHFARSLMPQIRGGSGDPNRCAFAEGGYNLYEPQCFEDTLHDPSSLYFPKENLEIEHPETITRAAMVRTPEYKLISRPQGQSELYIYKSDPQELHNRYGESSVAAIQTALQERLLHWYLNTSGIAPMDKDQRGFPQFYETPDFPVEKAVRSIVDDTR